MFNMVMFELKIRLVLQVAIVPLLLSPQLLSFCNGFESLEKSIQVFLD